MTQMIKMSAPSSALLPGGELRELAITIDVLGLSANTKSDYRTGVTRAEIPVEFVSLPDVLAVESCRFGQYWGRVESWPCWLLIPAEDLDNPVLEGLPNREDETGQILTWRSWHDDRHSGPRLSLDGSLALVATNGFGVDLEGSHVLALSEAGYDVKSQAEARALLADPAWTEPEV